MTVSKNLLEIFWKLVSHFKPYTFFINNLTHVLCINIIVLF